MSRADVRRALSVARKGHGKKNAKIRARNFVRRLEFIKRSHPENLPAFLARHHPAPARTPKLHGALDKEREAAQ